MEYNFIFSHLLSYWVVNLISETWNMSHLQCDIFQLKQSITGATYEINSHENSHETNLIIVVRSFLVSFFRRLDGIIIVRFGPIGASIVFKLLDSWEHGDKRGIEISLESLFLVRYIMATSLRMP